MFLGNTKTLYLMDVLMNNSERTLHLRAVTYIRQTMNFANVVTLGVDNIPTVSEQSSQQNTKPSYLMDVAI